MTKTLPEIKLRGYLYNFAKQILKQQQLREAKKNT